MGDNLDAFMTWLFQQECRDDPIGDLAQDAQRATDKPTTLPDLCQSIRKVEFQTDTSGARSALDDAIVEFCGYGDGAEMEDSYSTKKVAFSEGYQLGWTRRKKYGKTS